jgi:hypothetical protein
MNARDPFTEIVPIGLALRWAYSKYYLRKFCCEALAGNPDAELFLYTTWSNAQVQREDALTFEQQIGADRRYWEELADGAVSERLPKPGRLGRWLGHIGIREEPSTSIPPLRFISAGSAGASE